MATTTLDLIQAALEKLRVYAPGQPVNSADSARALAQFQRMMDRWSNSSLATFVNLEVSFPIIANKNAYSIGTSGGADVSSPRPLNIPMGYGTVLFVDSNGFRYPIEVVDQDRWNQLPILTITSQIPQAIFYDTPFPLGTINVYPMPSLAGTLTFDSRQQLAAIALTLTTNITFPPGYEAAIENNLCVELKPFFKGAQLDPDVKELARDTLADIKRTNMRPIIAQFDDAIVSRASPTYNIYKDEGA